MTYVSKAARSGLFILMALAITMTTMSGAALAQTTAVSGTAYTSELSGLEVEVFGDFQITSAQVENFQDGDGEIVNIESRDAILQVSFFDDNVAPASSLDSFNTGFALEMDDFQVIEQSVGRGIAWSLATISLDGTDYYYYLSVTPDIAGDVDVLTMLVAPPDVFFESIEAAQVDVTLDGNGIFAEADTAELTAIIENDGMPENGQSTGNSSTGRTGKRTRETTPASAGNVIVSDVTGMEVEVNEPWSVTDTRIVDEIDGPQEILSVESEGAFGNIGFFTGTDAEASVEDFRGGFETTAEELNPVASDYSNGAAWALDKAVLGDGTQAVLYVEVREGMDPDYLMLVAVVSSPEDFEYEFAAAQESMSVDGEPISTQLDQSDVGSLLDGDSATSTSSASSDDATVEAGGSPKSNTRREDAKLPAGDSTPVIENETETGKTGTTGATSDLEDAGLVSDNEYVSPQFDIDMTWGDSWTVDYADEESVTSSAADEMDSLTLMWTGDDFALLFIDISTADGLVPSDFVDYWTSVDYMSDNAAPDAENLLDRARMNSGAVVTRDYLDGGDEVIITKEALLLDEGEHLVVMTLIAPPELYEELYGDAEDDIQIAGAPALGTFSARQIERTIEP